MPSPSTAVLDDLIARLEAATGADREIDLAIFRFLNPEYAGPEWQPYGGGLRHVNDSSDARCLPGPEATPGVYTGSVDAAFAMVESRCPNCAFELVWAPTNARDDYAAICRLWPNDKIGLFDQPDKPQAATPALSICLAFFNSLNGNKKRRTRKRARLPVAQEGASA